MRNLIQLLFCSFFIITTGCSHNSEKEYLDSEQFYSLTDTLRGEILATPIQSKSGSVRLYYTEYGLLACTKLDNNIFQLLDSTDASMITATGRRGRGPDEFLMAIGMQYDYLTNRFSVFDMYTQEMITYLVSADTISLIRKVNLKKDMQSVQYINDSLLVFNNFYPHQKIGLMNAKRDVIYEQECNPLNDDRIKTTNAYHSIKLAVSPDKKYTVAVDGSFASIQVFFNKPDTLELQWEKILFEPKYKFNSKNDWYIRDDDNSDGFSTLYLTSKYIYLKCSDRRVRDSRMGVPESKHSSYILVMDYEGNIITKYLMDKFFVPFTVTPDDKYLYATIYDPDFLVAKYSL